ncbi:sporulation protein [Paenibacillus sp. Marseille-Q4541]|uniref:sporulation protein n=1 Tax=Paenibacillus sp. Marseille-Q4541 TaxID=2831522 RepID=UPI001BA745A4|nr:sporulation protein [Paenibacillus sp. Marseille-Q4541]
MSFFNKMLAKVGIGSAEIDTLLEKVSYVPGETVKGVVRIQGGSVDQEIESIYIQLMTRYIREQDDRKVEYSYTLAKFNVSEGLLLRSGEKLEIPFVFPLPLETPVTYNRQPVWLSTGLDIEMSIDPTDHDSIEVQPHFYMSAIFEAVEYLGFRYKTSSCEHATKLGRGVPFVQEFEYYPSTQFAGRVKELELMMNLDEDGIHVLVEVDRRARGLNGFFEQAFNLDERHARLYFDRADIAQGAKHIARQIERVIEEQSR